MATLDLTRRALLVIDVQNEYFSGKLPVTYPPGSLANVLRAMDAAHRAGMAVVIVQHTAPQADSSVFRKGSPQWELHPDVAARPHDLLIQKSLPGSFTGTDLEAWLRERNIGTVVIAGYMTQMCCDTTARQALHLGWNVEFLADATGTLAFDNAAGAVRDEELHRAILVTQQARFSSVLRTDEWIARLSRGQGQ
ncbi:MAG: cysteine hydrolase family protein [Terriglobales bacterium]